MKVLTATSTHHLRANRRYHRVGSSRRNIAREPHELFAAHEAHPNETVRDFIEYYIMWSWNWYPNRSVADPFDTSRGANELFDPANP